MVVRNASLPKPQSRFRLRLGGRGWRISLVATPDSVHSNELQLSLATTSYPHSSVMFRRYEPTKNELNGLTLRLRLGWEGGQSSSHARLST